MIIHRYERLDSTNRLAAEEGAPGEVFVAAEQSAGRGRLDHKWQSRAGENLLMSAVFDVAGQPPAEVATFPLVAGLAIARAVAGDSLRSSGSWGHSPYNEGGSCNVVKIKWPNDVYIDSRKVCGILCERHGDRIVVGIGLNVRQREFPEELREKATSLALCGIEAAVEEMLDRVLTELGLLYEEWRRGGFAALHPRFAALDFLKGREVTVMRTDDDVAPACGVCGGIAADGSLLVGDEKIFAGEVRW